MANGRPKVKKMKSHVQSREVRSFTHEDAMAAAFYRQVSPRRAQEIADSRMIQEDPHAIANLSGRPINKQFAANRFMETLSKCDSCNDVGDCRG